MSTKAVCPNCEAPQDAGLLCSSCCDALERDLGDVAAIVGELDITLSKQARIGAGSGTAGLARERMPISIGAMQAADNLSNVMTTWARDVAGDPPRLGNLTYPSASAAAVLLSHIPEIRRHPAAAELVDEITDAIHQARRAVDRPADRVFVGPCMSEQPDDEGRLVTCLEDLYARQGASTVRCKVCTWDHDVAERRAWLLKNAEDRLFTVREAAQMMGDVGGITVTEDRIRGYLRRSKIAYHPIGNGRGIRLGDLLTVVLDDGERKSA